MVFETRRACDGSYSISLTQEACRLGEGPSGWDARHSLAPGQSYPQKHLREVSTLAGVKGVSEYKKAIQEKQKSRESQGIIFSTYQYLTLIKSCILSKRYCPDITSRHFSQPNEFITSRRFRNLEVSVVNRSGKQAQKMTCTTKSPLNHRLHPVLSLLFLLCSLETSL